jgi:hypothetical protein
LDYRPVVNIRSCYSKEGKGLKNAVYEATKYVLKPLDMVDCAKSEMHAAWEFWLKKWLL